MPKAKLGEFECWTAGKTGAAVEKLGIKRVREILGGKAKDTLAALIAWVVKRTESTREITSTPAAR